MYIMTQIKTGILQPCNFLLGFQQYITTQSNYLMFTGQFDTLSICVICQVILVTGLTYYKHGILSSLSKEANVGTILPWLLICLARSGAGKIPASKKVF